MDLQEEARVGAATLLSADESLLSFPHIDSDYYNHKRRDKQRNAPPESLTHLAKKLKHLDDADDTQKIAELNALGLVPLTNLIRDIEQV